MNVAIGSAVGRSTEKASEDVIHDAAIAAELITLGEDALATVKSGVTSAEELFRVVTEVKEVRTLCPNWPGAGPVGYPSM